MENNIYFGTIFHRRKFKNNYKEKVILYTENNINYLDLDHIRWYDTDISKKDYVIKNSLYQTKLENNQNEYRYIINKIISEDIKNKEKRKKRIL